MKIAAYVRTAIANNDGAIESQEKAIKDYIRRNPGYEIYDFYTDAGVSGNSAFKERPAGARLIVDAEAGKFKKVLVVDSNRVARNLKILLKTVYYFKSLDIEVESITESFDFLSPKYSLTFGMISLISEHEKKAFVERMRLGKIKKRNERQSSLEGMQ
jgi:site-specific DNA recombinase